MTSLKQRERSDPCKIYLTRDNGWEASGEEKAADIIEEIIGIFADTMTEGAD